VSTDHPEKSDVKTITCENCEREVPAGSLHCPYCCGEDGQRGELKRGAYTGGILGMIVGAVCTAMFLSLFGPEYNTWPVVSGIILGFVIVGAALGVNNSRKA
jgi:Na+/proline symporter